MTAATTSTHATEDQHRLPGWDAPSVTLGLALCAVPTSIAATEILLGLALAVRIFHPQRVPILRPFWFWLAWASLETILWLRAPGAGFGEIRHLLLLATLYFMLPALQDATQRVVVWRGIFVTAGVSSAVLLCQFLWRLHHFSSQIATAPDPSFYLRSGGLLNHWMVYSTVEVLVFAGLLEFARAYPNQRRWWIPLLAINTVGILLSLTRMLWVSCLVLLALHLVWHHSRWIWSLPALAVVIALLAPSILRSRVQPDFYSNAERIEMLRVGERMIAAHPWTGVGPGRVEAEYASYLMPGELLPAYHGHLHNNAIQLAAEFGLPVLAAAVLFVTAVFRELLKRFRSARDREAQFLCRAAFLGLTGFLISGMFDYTYGHSLGLILLSFTTLAALL